MLLFSCLTCNPPPSDPAAPYTPAGVCYSCSISCHGEHTLVELFNKRNFVCDCGTTRIASTSPCTLRPNAQGEKGNVTGESPAAENKYNQNFKNKFCAAEGRPLLHFSSDAIAAIEAYNWPGNVREMENYIKRAVIMADGNTIVADDLGLPGEGAEEEPINLRQVRDEAEYKAIVKALARVDGNIVKASEILGVSRPTLYDLMGRHGIKTGA